MVPQSTTSNAEGHLYLLTDCIKELLQKKVPNNFQIYVRFLEREISYFDEQQQETIDEAVMQAKNHITYLQNKKINRLKRSNKKRKQQLRQFLQAVEQWRQQGLISKTFKNQSTT